MKRYYAADALCLALCSLVICVLSLLGRVIVMFDSVLASGTCTCAPDKLDWTLFIFPTSAVMPTPMVCDEALAKEVAAVLVPSIGASVALRCRDAAEGRRFFVHYECEDMYRGDLHRDQLRANLPTMQVSVPVLQGRKYHQKTIEAAVEKVSSDIGLNMDSKSIEKQAYKIRSLLSHLLRMKRETRLREDEDEIYKLAK